MSANQTVWRPIRFIGGVYPGLEKTKNKTLLDDWVKKNKIVEFSSDRSCNVPKCLHNMKTNHNYSDRVEPPFLDHVYEFRDINKNIVYVYHPYDDIHKVYPLAAFWALANLLDIRVYQKDESWYNPGSTCMVVLKDMFRSNGYDMTDDASINQILIKCNSIFGGKLFNVCEDESDFINTLRLDGVDEFLFTNPSDESYINDFINKDFKNILKSIEAYSVFIHSHKFQHKVLLEAHQRMITDCILHHDDNHCTRDDRDRIITYTNGLFSQLKAITSTY